MTTAAPPAPTAPVVDNRVLIDMEIVDLIIAEADRANVPCDHTLALEFLGMIDRALQEIRSNDNVYVYELDKAEVSTFHDLYAVIMAPGANEPAGDSAHGMILSSRLQPGEAALVHSGTAPGQKLSYCTAALELEA